jgi:hypothetical protein
MRASVRRRASAIHAMRAAFVLLALASPAAHANPLAIGLAPSTYELSDGSRGFAPEAFAHTYVSLGSRLVLRPGARIGARGLVQPEMPEGLRITERDFTAHAEAALTFDGTVVPSLSVMGGLDVRRINVEGAGIDVSMSRVAHTELLPYIAVQLGLGLPLAHGKWLVEPTIRREFLLGDSRAGWRFGLEVSFALRDR